MYSTVDDHKKCNIAVDSDKKCNIAKFTRAVHRIMLLGLVYVASSYDEKPPIMGEKKPLELVYEI